MPINLPPTQTTASRPRCKPPRSMMVHIPTHEGTREKIDRITRDHSSELLNLRLRIQAIEKALGITYTTEEIYNGEAVLGKELPREPEESFGGTIADLKGNRHHNDD